MKNKYYKITLFISIFTLLLAFLVIPSFAYDFNGVLTPGQVITLAENLDFTYTPYNPLFTFSIADDTSGELYGNIKYSYPGRSQLIYVDSNGEDHVVYDSGEGGWLDESYRHIVCHDTMVLSGVNLGFISINIVAPTTNAGIYDTLYGILTSTIYGDRTLTSFETNIATILATIICVICFALPFIVILWLTKMFLTLGRNW